MGIGKLKFWKLRFRLWKTSSWSGWNCADSIGVNIGRLTIIWIRN